MFAALSKDSSSPIKKSIALLPITIPAQAAKSSTLLVLANAVEFQNNGIKIKKQILFFA